MGRYIAAAALNDMYQDIAPKTNAHLDNPMCKF